MATGVVDGVVVGVVAGMVAGVVAEMITGVVAVPLLMVTSTVPGRMDWTVTPWSATTTSGTNWYVPTARPVRSTRT